MHKIKYTIFKVKKVTILSAKENLFRKFMMSSSHYNTKKITRQPIIGILGGAGPDATVDLQIKLLKAMRRRLNVFSDQDYYRSVIDNNTQIPDRSRAILFGGRSPLPEYIKSAKMLELMGATIIIIPCNTAHIYFNEIQKAVFPKIMNMIAETADYISLNHQGIKKVGLLSTAAVAHSNLYHGYLSKREIEIILPRKDSQLKIMQAIYGIKAGYASNNRLTKAEKEKLKEVYRNSYFSLEDTPNHLSPNTPPIKLLQEVVCEMEDFGVDNIILGCTELPLALNDKTHKGKSNLIDPLEVVAQKTIELCVK